MRALTGRALLCGLGKLLLSLNVNTVTAVTVLPPPAAAGRATATCTPEAFGAKLDGSDTTAAFQQAITNCSTVYVGTGTYRIDGTLVLHGRKQLHLTIGAVLARGEGTNNTAPVVRLDQLAVLDGRGTVSSSNPAPRGIVLVGPATTGYATEDGTATHKKVCSSIGNVLFATVEGVTILGRGEAVDLDQNPPWSPNSTVVQCGSWVADGSVAGQQLSIGAGQIGLCLDSSELNCGGACYQNTVRDVLIRYVDVGVYGGAIVNSNMFYNLMFFNLQTAIWMEANAENTFIGGFTGGGGFKPNTPAMLANAAIIRATGSEYNFFSSIQGEPGHGRFLDISGTENTIIGHDNCPIGSTLEDDRAIWTNSGTLQAGKVVAGQISASFPANTTGADDANIIEGASNAVAVVIGRLASIQGEGAFRVTISALTTTGSNWINPTTVELSTAEMLIVPYCCKSGVPTSNGVWDARVQILSSNGFAANPDVKTDGDHMTVLVPFSKHVSPVLSRSVTMTSVLTGRVPTVYDDTHTYPIKAPTANFANVSTSSNSTSGGVAPADRPRPSQEEEGEVKRLREVAASQELRITNLERALEKLLLLAVE